MCVIARIRHADAEQKEQTSVMRRGSIRVSVGPISVVGDFSQFYWTCV